LIEPWPVEMVKLERSLTIQMLLVQEKDEDKGKSQ